MHIPQIKHPLSEKGFTHLIVPVLIFIVVFGGIGTYVLFHANALTPIATPADLVYFKAGNGECLDDWHDGATGGNKVDIYGCNKTAAQQWDLKKETSSSNNYTYLVENVNGKACLDNWRALKKNNNPIVVYACNAKDSAQLWRVTNNTLVNAMNGMCISDPSGTTTDGTQLQLYTCLGNKNQKWTPTTVSTGTGTGGTPTPTPTPTPKPTPTADAGFITASGTNLMLNGKVWKGIGYDAYGMEGCWNGVTGAVWTNAQLDTYFSSLPSEGLTRIWAPQGAGTSILSNIVAQASKYGQHLILSLGNDDGQCDKGTEPGAFYENASVIIAGKPNTSSWQDTYVPWVDKVVPLFANNPTVAMWEIANEPGQAVSVPTATMESYMSGTAAAIKAVAPHQLVESGFNEAANAGGGEAAYEAVQSSPDVNVISFHSYPYDYEGKATLSGHFTDAQQAAKALNKPFIDGESGVEAGGSSCTAYLTQSQRVSYFKTQANDYLKGIGPSGAGSPSASAILFWDYVPEGPGATCSQYDYDILPSDPVVAMVKGYVAP